MLVLGRKRGESVVIGSDVTVTVLDVRGDRVKLGFSAPGGVPIHRAEVHQDIENGARAEDDLMGVSLAMNVELCSPEFQGVAV